MTDDEMETLREELAAARAEIERLQVTAADREARAAHLESTAAGLRDELASAKAALAEREAETASLRQVVDEGRASLLAAVQRYRDVSLASQPDLPAELVTGETLEEVDRSLEAARRTVAQVRGHLEAQAAAGRVPPGAPPRSAPDLSALSPAEKIRAGLARQAER